MVTTEDRFKGCLLGGAVGDALGAPVEFLSAADIRRKYGEAGIRDLEPSYGVMGAITDDTQMTLFTAEGCIRYGDTPFAMDANERDALIESIESAYGRWFATQGGVGDGSEGYLATIPAMRNQRAPGNTCMGALRSGRPVASSKGCGGVMRVAPVGLFMAGVAREHVFEAGSRSAAITHGHPSGYLAAGFLAALVAGIIEGETLRQSLEVAVEVLEDQQDHEEVLASVEAAIRLSEAAPDRAEVFSTLGQGWVAEEALAIALYSSMAMPNLEEAVVFAANHGGDSDSTASIAGQITGALTGAGSIPERWLEHLELKDVIEEVARDLYRAQRWEDRPELDQVYGRTAS